MTESYAINRERVISALFWLGMLFAAFSGVFLGRGLLFRGPLYLFNVPLQKFFVERVLEGQVPLWCSGIFCGYPLAAEINFGMFYPLTWLVIGFAPDCAVTMAVIVHYCIAGLGAYLYGRRIGLSVFASTGCALVWPFNGFLLDYHDQLQGLRTMSWLPWVLWALEGSGVRRSTGSEDGELAAAPSLPYVLLAGLFLGLQFLGGHFQYSYYIMFVVAAYFVFQAWGEERRVSLLAKYLLAGAIGLLIFAVQLLPTYELTRETPRASVTYDQVVSNPDDQLTLSTAIKFLFPNYELGPFDKVQPGYFGVVALLLAALAPKSGRRHWKLFAVLGAISVVLALGRYSPLYRLCYWYLPGFRLLKDPLRAEMILIFSLSVLAGLGLDAILEKRVRVGTLAWALGVVAAIGISVSAMILHRELRFLGPNPPALREVEDPLFMSYAARSDLLPFALAAAGFLLVAFLRLSEVLGRLLAGAGILLCLALSLYHYAGWAIVVAPRGIYTKVPPAVAAMRKTQGFFRKYTDAVAWRSFERYQYAMQEYSSGWVRLKRRWINRGDETVGLGGNALFLTGAEKQRRANLPPPPAFYQNDAIIGNTGLLYGIRSADGFTTFPLRRISELARCSRTPDPFAHSLYPQFLLRAGLRKLFGVKYVLSVDEKLTRDALEQVGPDGRIKGTQLRTLPEMVERASVLAELPRFAARKDVKGMIEMPYFYRSRHTLYEFLGGEAVEVIGSGIAVFGADELDRVCSPEFEPGNASFFGSHEPESIVGAPISSPPLVPWVSDCVHEWDGRFQFTVSAGYIGAATSVPAHPGWRMFVDGREEAPCVSNHAFLGVELTRVFPRATVECDFVFDPPSFRYGLALSLMGVFLIGGGLAFAMRRVG